MSEDDPYFDENDNIIDANGYSNWVLKNLLSAVNNNAIGPIFAVEIKQAIEALQTEIEALKSPWISVEDVTKENYPEAGWFIVERASPRSPMIGLWSGTFWAYDYSDLMKEATGVMPIPVTSPTDRGEGNA